MNLEAQKAFNTIERSITSKPVRKLFRVATNAFLEADGNPRPEHAEGASTSGLSRFYNDYTWNLRFIIRTIRNTIKQKLVNLARHKRTRKHVLQLMIDLTSLQKTGEFLTTKRT